MKRSECRITRHFWTKCRIVRTCAVVTKMLHFTESTRLATRTTRNKWPVQQEQRRMSNPSRMSFPTFTFRQSILRRLQTETPILNCFLATGKRLPMMSHPAHKQNSRSYPLSVRASTNKSKPWNRNESTLLHGRSFLSTPLRIQIETNKRHSAIHHNSNFTPTIFLLTTI